MRNKIKRITLVISILFFLLWIISLILNVNNYIWNIQAYTQFSVPTLFFSISGLFMYIFFMFETPKVYKFIFTSVAFISAFVLMILLALGTEGKTIIEEDSHTLIVFHYSYLFAGHDTYYEKRNILVSRYIATGEGGEDINTSYEIENDVLILTTCGNSSNSTCNSVEYPLQD